MMSKIPIEVVNIADGLDLIKGAGGNVAVLRGPDGLLVVDSQIPREGKRSFGNSPANWRQTRLDPDQHALALRPRRGQ